MQERWEDLPQCERFRWAFLLRDMRRAEKAREAQRRERLHQERRRTRGQQAIDGWLDDLKLA